MKLAIRFRLTPLLRTPFLMAAALAGLTVTCSWSPDARVDLLQLNKGDSVVFIGNTFAERMHLFGYFETLLHSKYPDYQLRVRNMGWSGDELTLMPRPKGFGDRHKYLSEHRADLIFACFGMNESFKGSEGLGRFQEDLDRFIDDLHTHQYNGQSAPRIVLVSPIAHENISERLPDAATHNMQLEAYTRAMARTARQHDLLFVDLFTPTGELMNSGSARKLTFNGIHLTEYGYWRVSQIMARSLGLISETAEPTAAGNTMAEDLRRTIYEKNYYFFIRWRGTNREYIHGERNHMPGAERLPQEMDHFEQIIDAYDRNIWQMDKPSPEQVWQQLPEGRPIWATTPQYGSASQSHTGTDQYEGARILSPNQAIETFELPKGYAINLYASEEDFPIANPMAMHFDAEGRLWVANTPTWPQPRPGEQPTDSIVVLEDTDHDGVADEHTVFVDKLNMIHGFALGDGGAYISQAPNLIHAKDTSGDGRADQFRMLLHGFGTEDIEHAMNNFKWGPDGAFYFMEGIFFHSQVETPYAMHREGYMSPRLSRSWRPLDFWNLDRSKG